MGFQGESVRKNEPQPRKTTEHREIMGLTFLVLNFLIFLFCTKVWHIAVLEVLRKPSTNQGIESPNRINKSNQCIWENYRQVIGAFKGPLKGNKGLLKGIFRDV